MASFLVLYLVMRSEWTGATRPTLKLCGCAGEWYEALAVVGYGVLIRAALVGYLPAALFVCVIAFQ
ncbi:hypothetical protein [Mycolicibacterium fortuitum]|uniref:hypothetical protein n=1 Tax=Mycolicibacterium fortuitum TaxID=1766 RepID=UPI00260B7858|nr:hypothetical protein [Mycolicibacterium fortuitum]